MSKHPLVSIGLGVVLLGASSSSLAVTIDWINPANGDWFDAGNWLNGLVPTTDLLLDRGMMGDGVIDLPKIRSWVEAAGFDGYTEVEIMSAQNWWKRDPDEVVTVCLERMQTVV